MPPHKKAHMDPPPPCPNSQTRPDFNFLTHNHPFVPSHSHFSFSHPTPGSISKPYLRSPLLFLNLCLPPLNRFAATATATKLDGDGDGDSNDSAARQQALVKKDPVRRQVLRVKGCLAGSKAEKLLEQGDMILAVNKEPITCFRDIENACQELDTCPDTDGALKLTIFRQGKEVELVVGTDIRDGNGTTHMVNWCGSVIQDPHSAVRALGFLPEEGHGVYVARWCHGSPVHRFGLYALQWIIEINGKPTPDLETFLKVVKELDHGEFVRVKTVFLNGKPRVLTLKQDLHYWPTWEVKFDAETATWRRRVIKALDSTVT